MAVVIAFFICWAPFHTQRLMSIYVPSEDKWTTAIQSLLYFVSGILYYVSSVINPILYNIMSLKFRKSFRTTLLRPCCRLAQSQQKARPKLTYRYRSRTAALPTTPGRPTAADSGPQPPPPRLAIVRVTGSSRGDTSGRCDQDPSTSAHNQLRSTGLCHLTTATESSVRSFASRRRHLRGALWPRVSSAGEGQFVDAGGPTSVQSVEEGIERRTVVMIAISRPWHSCV